MDSTTLLGLAGIVGTLLGTTVGAGGTFGAARVTSRGQADVEEQKARRQVYGTCATVLLVRRDAAAALLDAFREDSFDSTAAQALLQNLDAQRDGVARAVGAAAVEGPDTVANSAEFAAAALEELAARLRDWVASVASGRDREELVRSQLPFALADVRQMQQQVGDFTAECRKVLHPDESRRSTRRRRLRLR
jgi:hypothetical protein